MTYSTAQKETTYKQYTTFKYSMHKIRYTIVHLVSIKQAPAKHVNKCHQHSFPNVSALWQSANRHPPQPFRMRILKRSAGSLS